MKILLFFVLILARISVAYELLPLEKEIYPQPKSPCNTGKNLDFYGIYRIGADLSAPLLLKELPHEAVRVGVIDSGFKADHALLQDRVHLTLGNASEKLAHGTHVAGTLAGFGDFSVAGQCHIGLYFAEEKNSHSINEVFKELLYNKVSFISRSMNCIGQCQIAQNDDINLLKQTLKESSALLVNSAGNDGEQLSDIDPDENDSVLLVGNITRPGLRNPSSNYGKQLFITAPGTDILSIAVEEISISGKKQKVFGEHLLVADDGTSMAAPHVSGAIAVMLHLNQTLSRQMIIDILRTMAIKKGREQRDPYYGFGVLNAYGSARMALVLKRGMDLSEAKEVLRAKSSMLWLKAMQNLHKAKLSGSLDLFKSVERQLRKAYFLDPNNKDRMQSLFLFQKHFGYHEEAISIAIDLFLSTGDGEYLNDLSLGNLSDLRGELIRNPAILMHFKKMDIDFHRILDNLEKSIFARMFEDAKARQESASSFNIEIGQENLNLF